MKCLQTQMPTQKIATHDHSKKTEKNPEENSMGTVTTVVSGNTKKPNAERRSETTNTVNNTQTMTGTDEMGQGTTETMTVITPGTDYGTIVIHGTINPNTIKNWSVKSAAILLYTANCFQRTKGASAYRNVPYDKQDQRENNEFRREFKRSRNTCPANELTNDHQPEEESMSERFESDDSKNM